jgi:hypothetical protein
MITKFATYKDKPDVNKLSPEFWKMTRVANWNLTIKQYLKDRPAANLFSGDNYYELAQFRIYSKYEFEQIREFYIEYHEFYLKLYDYFFDLWSSPAHHYIMPSDDEYLDMISSIIGRGKTFTKKCINDPQLFINMAQNDDYIQNFGDILSVDRNEYDNVKAKYDPYFNDIRKYNL